MKGKTFGIIGVTVGALGLALGGLSIASADEQPAASTTSSAQVQDDCQDGPGKGETPLTGADADKATAAAAAAVPGGTVLRVETDDDGTFEAHVRKADGTEVEVKMDKDFNVTSIEEHSRGDHDKGDEGETPLTGADADKATAAAAAAVPGGTVLRVETDDDGTFEAHVRKADGTEVEVKMDKDFNVTSIEEHSRGDHDKGDGASHEQEDNSTTSAS